VYAFFVIAHCFVSRLIVLSKCYLATVMVCAFLTACILCLYFLLFHMFICCYTTPNVQHPCTRIRHFRHFNHSLLHNLLTWRFIHIPENPESHAGKVWSWKSPGKWDVMELEFYHEKCVIWHACTHIHGKDCLILSAIGDNKYGRMCYIHLSVIAEILHWEWCSAVLCPGWLMCKSVAVVN